MSRSLRVFIYSDHPSPSLRTQIVAGYLERFGFSVSDRGSLTDFLSLPEDELFHFAELIAGTRVDDISVPLDAVASPAPVDTLSEIDKLKGKKSYRGEFYDGLWIQRIYHRAIAGKVPDELGEGFVHLIFTSRLFGTFEGRRYHARVVLGGSPSIVSTSGLVEAPAKPREYYFIKGALVRSGKDAGELDRMYEGRFVDYDDPKTSSIICSYALQAVYYELTGTAFCDDPSCCLCNSHWQEEVLKVQYEGKPCDKCLKEIRDCMEK